MLPDSLSDCNFQLAALTSRHWLEGMLPKEDMWALVGALAAAPLWSLWMVLIVALWIAVGTVRPEWLSFEYDAFCVTGRLVFMKLLASGAVVTRLAFLEL